MKSLYSDKEADEFKTDLDLRVYTSRLLGQDTSLVLHGGGNTSVKSTATNLFGETEDILYVKGSGWDLATIEAQGFAPVKMEMLLKMAELTELSDTDMVKYQRLAMTDPSAPNPSVEAILHAIIPFKFVDHTHADAVVTITNTIGGGGFGVMAILVGIHRGFISREQGAERIWKIVDFLANKIEKFHGAFPHWFNGTTGEVVNFGIQDGGDIVETAFMIEGLLTVRQYFDQQNSTEEQIRNLITQLWQNVDWDFYRNNSTGLYWNWSPTMGFNFSETFIFHGWGETLMPYLLAIASPTNAVNLPAASFYRTGWGNSDQIASLRQFYGYLLYVGSSYGGPLFFTHYSFIGFDPRNKKDLYTNYYIHNKNQSLVNRAYCIDNPKNFIGYEENNWGLTASYSIPGVEYLAHEPNNDNGTISPTAALSSMPYIPNESIAALKHFYRTFSSDLWGDFGFKDAFNLTYSEKGVIGEWFSDGYLAIDQGPIICMIENYRSGLLWEKFMSSPEIQPALNAIGFLPDSTTEVKYVTNAVNDFELLGNYPNPFNPATTIVFNLSATENVTIEIYNHLGEKVRGLTNEEFSAGENKITWNGLNDDNKIVSSGIYLYKINTSYSTLYGKMILQK